MARVARISARGQIQYYQSGWGWRSAFGPKAKVARQRGQGEGGCEADVDAACRLIKIDTKATA